MSAYIYPTSTLNVSDDFEDHVSRGSVNPGTDYTAAYGSKVFSIASGVVTDADGSPDGSGGRTIHVDNDDGSGADYLHMSALSVSVGDRVAQGKLLGYSGASGFGENYYYGAHLHISFRRNHSPGYGNVGNIDFDAMMRNSNTAGGNATPINEEVEMTPEQAQKLDSIYGFLVGGGTDIGTFKPAPGTILARLQHVESIVAQPVSRPNGKTSQIQDDADTGTIVRQILALVQSLQK